MVMFMIEFLLGLHVGLKVFISYRRNQKSKKRIISPSVCAIVRPIQAGRRNTDGPHFDVAMYLQWQLCFGWLWANIYTFVYLFIT